MSKTITIPNRHGSLGINGDVVVNVDDFAAFVARAQAGATLSEIPNRWAVAGLLDWDDREQVFVTPRGEDLLASAHLIPDDPAPEQPSALPCEACNGTGEQMLLVSTHVCDVCHGSKVKPATQTGRVSIAGNRRVLDSLGFTGVLSPVSEGIHTQYNPRPYTQRVLGLNSLYVTHAESGRVSSSRPNTSSLPRYSATVHVESDGTRVKTEKLPGGRTVRSRQDATEPNPWVLVDSEDVARSFIGKHVEIDAPAVRSLAASSQHTAIAHIYDVDDDMIYIANSHDDIAWSLRGNVRLRVVGGSDV